MPATPTPSGAGGLIDVPIAYEFLSSLQDLPPSDGVVVWDSSGHRFDYISWEGQRFPLLRITLPPGEEGAYSPAPIFGPSQRILINSYKRDEIYVFDLTSSEAWGYAPGCHGRGISSDWSAGPAYVVFRCLDDDPSVYHAVSLADPSAQVVNLTLPPSITKADFYVPVWTSENDLTVRAAPNGSERGWCTTTLPEPDFKCLTSQYWAGAVSPDGLSIEVREDYDSPSISQSSPDRVGVAPAACITLGGTNCEPRWYQVNGIIANWDDINSPDFNRVLAFPAAWSPDGENLVFIVEQELVSGMTPPSPPGNDIWRLNLETGAFTHLRHIPSLSSGSISGFPNFRWLDSYGGQVLPSIWAPDGERVLLDEPDSYDPRHGNYPLYLLSIKDGSLTVLAEDAGPVLGPLSVP